MENCLANKEIYYKSIEEYKMDIDNIIISMLKKNERFVFADLAEKAGVTRFVVRKYPELRNYILEKMVYYKEIQVINAKINNAVKLLTKAHKNLTFMSIIKKCNFQSEIIYQNPYIKEKIRSVIANKKSSL